MDVITRSIDDVQLKGLKGSEQIQNRLRFVLDQLNRRSAAIEKRFKLPEDSAAPSDIPRSRVVDGKIVPVEQ